MGARIRTSTVPGGLPFACDAAFLARIDMLNLVTELGDLDLSFHPSGTGGFADLIQRAETMTVEDRAVRVAALEDVIRWLPVLRQLLQEIRAREGQEGGER
jgi:hypothetical protein